MSALESLNANKPWLKWVLLLLLGLVIGSVAFFYISTLILEFGYLKKISKNLINLPIAQRTWFEYYRLFFWPENPQLLNELIRSFPSYKEFVYLHQAISSSGKTAGTISGIIAFIPALLVALKPNTRSLHGEARFARIGEVKKSGLITKDSGILLGKFQNEFLKLTGPRFVALAAPTRAGKGVGIVIPNLLNWEGSVVCLDIKGENFDKTSGFRSQYQTVYKFDPFSDNKETHCYNPLTYISSDPAQAISDIQGIARIFWPRTNQDPIWNDSSVNLFQGIVLYILDVNARLTMGEVLVVAGIFGQTNNAGWTHFKNRMAELKTPFSPRTTAALNQYFSLPDETRNSVLGTFNAALQIFSNPMVDAATSKDDFDLRTLRQRRQSVYLCVAANRLGAAAPLMNLFFSQLIQVNTKLLPEQDPSLKHSVLVLLDEFTALGKVEIIEKSISYIAGYNLRLLLIYQSQAQLSSVYGQESARNIITNCGCQILFSPREQSDAEEYSKILGTTTVKTRSKSRSVGLSFGKGNNPTDSISEQSRPLMLPQEMKEMGKEKSVIIIEDVKPIFSDKIRYYQENCFTERLLAPYKVDPITIDKRLLGLREDAEEKPAEKQQADNPYVNENAEEADKKLEEARQATLENFEEDEQQLYESLGQKAS